MISKRLAAYSIVSIVIVYSILQFNSYFLFTSGPIELPDNLRLTALYLLVLCSLFLGQSCLVWYQQTRYKQAKLLGHTPPPLSFPLLSFEFSFLESTMPLSRFVEILTLFILNGWLKASLPIPASADPLQVMANRSAQLALVNLAVSVVFSVRRSWFQLKTMVWHAWFGRLAFIQTMVHVSWQLQPLYDHLLNVRHLSGLVMFSALALLIVGSHPLVRALSYRLFRVTHLVAFLLLVLMGCLHDRLFMVFYGAVALFWVTDQLDRSFESEHVRLEPLPGNIVRICCQVPYVHDALLPGQFVLLSFDRSWWKAMFHSHPFSLARVVDEAGSSCFVFYAKVKGKNTRALYEASPDKKIVARLSKPLGNPFITRSGAEFGDYETVVLVAEGVGITPWILLFQYMQEKQHVVKTKTLYLLWSIHTIDTWYAFERELNAFVDAIQLDLSIQVYITGPEEDETIPNPLPSIQFHYGIRPNYNDAFFDADNNRPTVLGICGHPSTMVTTNNIALTYGWSIRKERFEL